MYIIHKLANKFVLGFVSGFSPNLIIREERWTRFLLSIIKFVNHHMMHSIKYRLREADDDELEESEKEAGR